MCERVEVSAGLECDPEEELHVGAITYCMLEKYVLLHA